MKKLSQKIRTAIWMEEPSASNPFYPENSYCHGYNFFNELIKKRDFIALVFLTLTGELPTSQQEHHLSLLLSSVMNAGPRDPANRAAMSAATGGAPSGSALIAGLCAATGESVGGGAVQRVMEMLEDLGRLHRDRGMKTISIKYLYDTYATSGCMPGFGTLFGEKDCQADAVVSLLLESRYDGPALRLFLKISKFIQRKEELWPRLYGVFAASLLDIGVSPVQGHGLYMLAGGVGMLGFLSERYTRHWTDYPSWFSHGYYNYRPASGVSPKTTGGRK